MKKTKKTSSINKKVRNATKVTVDGINFKSKLEVYTYKKLQENEIYAKYEDRKFTLLEAFIYDDKKIRPMTYTPDFVGEWFVIECKGRANDSFPLRWKLFKYYLTTNDIQYKLFLPRNQKQVDEVIKEILLRDE